MNTGRRELRLLLGRGLRVGIDGCVAVLLPAYLLALGHGVWQVGVLSTATLLGSALATLALGGALFAGGWLAAPLACGVIKITYDLALWSAFRRRLP